MTEQIEIISFYEFKDISVLGPVSDLRATIRQLLIDLDLRGTIILASEGFNGMVCGPHDRIASFVPKLEAILCTKLELKSSFHEARPFRRVDVKVKNEIVTFKQTVDMSLGAGTHVAPDQWNSLISDPETVILDTRNDYEFETGTFRHALNPNVKKFSDLAVYAREHLDPARHKRVAMFCTGGIRCEKFAPYLKGMGFEEVYQLKGGILKYLESVPSDQSLWEGECFVFDDRISVDNGLQKGNLPDLSQEAAAITGQPE